MSSRALRKLQKQREQEAQLALSGHDDDRMSADEEPEILLSKPKINAFDLLNTPHEDDDDDQESDSGNLPEPISVSPIASAATSRSSEKKKRKKKRKKAGEKHTNTTPAATEEDLDDIDRALKELSTTDRRTITTEENLKSTEGNVDARFAKSAEDLLSVDPKSLNAMNEMRKLFGNVVLESFDQPENEGSGRRRERRREMIDLGRALTGRYSPASRGQSLAGVTLRKNILMQGKDEWPRATSGGLGMELVEKRPSGSSLYQLVHNQAYQDVQMQFEMCVESMDPQRLIHLLQYNRKSSTYSNSNQSRCLTPCSIPYFYVASSFRYS
jgi:hypothetical protein